jgi:hypothetical protein
VVAEDVRIAEELARWLRTRPSAHDVQVIRAPHAVRRHGLRLPKPPFLQTPTPTFEIRLVYKGEPRLLRYYIEQDDDPVAMVSTLLVHTNGELMVRVPMEYGHLAPNDIYYRNGSRFAPGVGDPAPNIHSK